MKTIFDFLREDEATTAVEYAVMLGMIIMTAIVAISALGSASGGMWGGIDGELQAHGF